MIMMMKTYDTVQSVCIKNDNEDDDTVQSVCIKNDYDDTVQSVWIKK